MLTFASSRGWIFWSWKTELSSDTWDYRVSLAIRSRQTALRGTDTPFRRQRAVKAGYLPSHISKIDSSVCDGY